jgi:hypothetical protein
VRKADPSTYPRKHLDFENMPNVGTVIIWEEHWRVEGVHFVGLRWILQKGLQFGVTFAAGKACLEGSAFKTRPEEFIDDLTCGMD